MPSVPSQLVALALLWLVGVGLRLPILAVPPVIPAMVSDLNLSGTDIGLLSGLPVALFGAAALLGSLLIARFGALQILVAGLVAAGVTSTLRGAGGADVWVLYAATAAMGVGIAVVQPAVPSLIRQWLPGRISFGSVVYTNGLLVGETLPPALAMPFVLPLLGDSWRASLVFWSVPLAIIAVLSAWAAPSSKETAARSSSGERQAWWPDWRDMQIWQVALIFGAANTTYFATNGFLPGYLAAVGRPEWVGAALTALNLCQLPASFALMVFASRLERRAWPFVIAGVLTLASVAGIVCTASGWTVLFAGLVGFLVGMVFTLGLALIPLLSAPSSVARLSAAVFTISYTEALLVSVVSGMAADWSGSVRFAFIPIAASLLPLIVIPPLSRFNRRSVPAV